jgi:predicted amidohydrolase
MRNLTVAAAQLGPIQKSDDRKSVVTRLIELLRDAHSKKAELVVFPELALTTFFPRWFVDDITEADHWYETEMPSAITKPLFDEAKKLGIGFCLGYAELTQSGERFNTQILVERDGRVVAKYRKVHIPGHEQHEPDRPFQHADMQRSSMARVLSRDGPTRRRNDSLRLQHSSALCARPISRCTAGFSQCISDAKWRLSKWNICCWRG